ncbi:MAG: MarR family transcriptional regulator [Aeromicrobium sp.]|nr:MAG: MarR family transcriptional regulator [Aeromicrobium sp.]
MAQAQDSSARETPWLTKEQQVIWRSFLGGTTVLMDHLDRDLRSAHGLSLPEYEILVRLSEAPDRAIRMADLAEAIAHSRSRTTHTIRRLEKEGIVTRFQCDSDGRGVTAMLTDAGYALLEQAAHTHVAGVHDYLVASASAEEFKALGAIMSRVREQLDGKSF